MKFFLTGGTGFLGSNLLQHLIGNGHEVHALGRNLIERQLLVHKNAKWFEGAIGNYTTVLKAMKSCDVVVHTAALARPWHKNPAMFYNVNVKGTANVLECALELQIEKVVVISSASVFETSGHHSITENNIPLNGFQFHYSQSKFIMEWLVLNYVNKGLNAVILNPTRVYGPGLLEYGNYHTRFIRNYINNKVVFGPPDMNITANYVFVDDVIKAVLLALQYGKAGERYIIGGENLTFRKFFSTIKEVTGLHHKVICTPYGIIRILAAIELLRGKFTNHQPLMTPGYVRKLGYDYAYDISKARDQLHYHPLNFRQGVEKTVKWLMENNYIPVKNNHAESLEIATNGYDKDMLNIDKQ